MELIRALLVLLAFACGACADPATLNLSRDLQSLGIAKQNLQPNNPNQDARPLFQAALAYAAKLAPTLPTSS